MATVTLTSTRSGTISHTLAYENKITHLRDASFSSYLNSSEETFVLKHGEATMKPSTTITTPQEPMYQVSLGRKKNGYGEIGVFGAEKYFNGVMDEGETVTANKDGKRQQPKKDRKVDIQDMKPNTKSGTPSTCSEASWNSRSALLPVMQSRQDKANGKNFFAALGCNCYCSDNKSVDVDENTADNKNSISSKKNVDCGEIHGGMVAKLPVEVKHDPIGLVQIKKTPSPSWLKEETPCNKSDKGGNRLHSEECFTLPIQNSAVRNPSLENKFAKVDEENARRSLEVFGSPVLDKDDIALSLEKRLSMLTWDANPRVGNIPTLPIVRSEPIEDIDSDSSSDLFEIKSLASNGHPFFKHQASDGMSPCMSPNNYEPSEASIDWSVVTASAANFSSADYDETKSIANGTNHDTLKTTAAKTRTTSTKTEMSKDIPKRRPSMLLGCRSHKAVKVMGGAHKLPEKKSEFSGPRSRFQAESKVIDLDSAHAQRAFALGPLSQLHPARATDSIYIH